MYFDRLLLMCDGHIVYQGVANQSPGYFGSIGFKLGQFCNPADVFMRILSINYPKGQDDDTKVKLLVQCYNSKLRPIID